MHDSRFIFDQRRFIMKLSHQLLFIGAFALVYAGIFSSYVLFVIAAVCWRVARAWALRGI